MIMILFIIYQQSTLNIYDATEHESSGVVSAPVGADFQAYPLKNCFVDNFRFTKGSTESLHKLQSISL